MLSFLIMMRFPQHMLQSRLTSFQRRGWAGLDSFCSSTVCPPRRAFNLHPHLLAELISSPPQTPQALFVGRGWGEGRAGRGARRGWGPIPGVARPTHLDLTLRHPQRISQASPLGPRQVLRLLERLLQSEDLLPRERGSRVFSLPVFVQQNGSLICDIDKRGQRGEIIGYKRLRGKETNLQSGVLVGKESLPRRGFPRAVGGASSPTAALWLVIAP